MAEIRITTTAVQANKQQHHGRIQDFPKGWVGTRDTKCGGGGRFRSDTKSGGGGGGGCCPALQARYKKRGGRGGGGGLNAEEGAVPYITPPPPPPPRTITHAYTNEDIYICYGPIKNLTRFKAGRPF